MPNPTRAAALQLSQGTFDFFFFFFLLHLYLKCQRAPVAFSIMLCGCSQQESVIALGLEAQGRAVRGSRRTHQVERVSVCFSWCVQPPPSRPTRIKPSALVLRPRRVSCLHTRRTFASSRSPLDGPTATQSGPPGPVGAVTRAPSPPPSGLLEPGGK